jgi:methyl-accepting chemotaxis protein
VRWPADQRVVEIKEPEMRLSVRTKLFAGFGAVVAVAAVLGIVAVLNMGSMNHDTVAVTDTDLPTVLLVGHVATAAGQYRTDQFEASSATTAAAASTYLKRLDGAERTIAGDFRDLAPLATSPADRADLAGARASWTAYVEHTPAFAAAVRAGNHTQADALLGGSTRADYEQLSSDLTKWSDASRTAAQGSAAKAKSSYTSALDLTLVLIALGLVIGAAVAWFVSRLIVSGVTQMRNAANAIAEGDVDQQVDVRSRDELGETAAAFTRMIAYLKRMAAAAERIADADLTVRVEAECERDLLGHAFTRMLDNLRSMVSSINEASQTLAASSQEVASSSEEAGRAAGEIAHAVSEVAQGAERQARMADQTRTATHETGEAAEEAETIARRGVEAAERADEAMRSVRASTQAVTEAMNGLGVKSAEIGGIVETITGIAGQTNLLALNAAIEAARAGEQGKGFAVVAEEVRKLAEEAQTAAESISGLVAEIQSETDRAANVVEAGASQTEESAAVVAEARQAFEEIGGAVNTMRGRIEEIVSAAGEVASVAEQSSASAEQVSASTEETSASTQEIAASAQQLASTADDLARLVGRFTVVATS